MGIQFVIDVLQKSEAFFEKAGLDKPKVEAEWLVAGTLGCKRLELYLQWDRPLEEPILEQLRENVKRRSRGEPLQYVLGYSDFHDIRLSVAPGVLIPRPETELLVVKVIEALSDLDSPRIVDLGTGSGAIALALGKALPGARILAIDSSADALKQARANAEALALRDRVSFRSGHWLQNLDFEADCIVSNPPYLTESEWEEAQREVREFEPKKALVAGDSGMADLKVIVREARARLASGGLLALEMGIAHGAPLGEFVIKNDYTAAQVLQDDSGRDRFLFARR